MRRVYGFFWLRIARPHGFFLRENRGFKELRSFPDMELGIFRVAKSPGEGRLHDCWQRPMKGSL